MRIFFLLHITCGTHFVFGHYIMEHLYISFGFDTESVMAVTWYQSHERLGTKICVTMGWNTRALQLYFE